MARKTSELLTEAYQFLANSLLDGRTIYLCHAIGAVPCRDLEEIEKKAAVIGRIDDELKVFVSFDAKFDSNIHWLSGGTSRRRWIQLRRREFLCNLISEYERKGD